MEPPSQSLSFSPQRPLKQESPRRRKTSSPLKRTFEPVFESTIKDKSLLADVKPTARSYKTKTNYFKKSK